MTPAEPPSRGGLGALRRSAAGCQACPLFERATQTVFGEGPAGAPLMLVGEQPGDHEDREGHPFVGPAGQLLDRALRDAGIDREAAYVTNAVKHFKWEARGKRRLHKRPSAAEVGACRPWLEAEIRSVRPAIVVAMGATAAGSLLGPTVKVTRDRGRVVERPAGPPVLVTIHPSAILRLRSSADREQEVAEFTEDLKVAWAVAQTVDARAFDDNGVGNRPERSAR